MPNKPTYYGIPTEAKPPSGKAGLWMQVTDGSYELSAAERKMIRRWFKANKDGPGILMLPGASMGKAKRKGKA